MEFAIYGLVIALCFWLVKWGVSKLFNNIRVNMSSVVNAMQDMNEVTLLKLTGFISRNCNFKQPKRTKVPNFNEALFGVLQQAITNFSNGVTDTKLEEFVKEKSPWLIQSIIIDFDKEQGEVLERALKFITNCLEGAQHGIEHQDPIEEEEARQKFINYLGIKDWRYNI